MKFALLLVALVVVSSSVCLSAEPTMDDFWNGRASLQYDAAQIGSYFGFIFPSVLTESNELWAYYIKTRVDFGMGKWLVGRARSTDGIWWADDGQVLDVGSPWQCGWQSQDGAIGHQIGRIDNDGWSANVADDSAGWLCFGPYTTNVAAGDHIACWTMMIDNNANDDIVAWIDVSDATTGTRLTYAPIYRNQFRKTWSYQTFTLNFTAPTDYHALEFRVFWEDKAYMRVGSIGVAQDPPAWDGRLASFPGIWKDNGTYYLVYEGADDSGYWPGDIGLATSTDGIHFTKDPANPILRHDTFGWEQGNIGTPSLYKQGNMWYLFYHAAGISDCQIGVATGTDLHSLTKYSGNPIVATTSGAWDAGTAGRRSQIIKAGDYYYMAYEGSTDNVNGDYGAANWSTGIARSPDLFHWTKYPGNPVGPVTYRSYGYDGPEVMVIGGVTYLYLRTPMTWEWPTMRYRVTWNPISTIAAAKADHQDGEAVYLTSNALYMKQSGFGYIEDTSQTAGIRIEGTISAHEGDLVDLTGVMRTSLGGERYIEMTSPATSSGTHPIKPFGAANSSLDSALLDGLLVTSCGRVMEGTVTSNSFVITDGSSADGVKVITSDAPGVSAGQRVMVTGAAGYDGARVIYRRSSRTL